MAFRMRYPPMAVSEDTSVGKRSKGNEGIAMTLEASRLHLIGPNSLGQQARPSGVRGDGRRIKLTCRTGYKALSCRYSLCRSVQLGQRV